ncbi:hypothetical protein AHiyo1_50650 [Arthrobacter sp. Hiyo1]|uniref:hypothetical protein n=1 Tax=Arthrobacter sp. Hiyo1 TaxID=1588020 RepID=UPI0006A3DD7A|nr:hypothetical protein [Arthrobacter sp. Hiyo1]GAP61365.1 hypothetical protein AHiyo1_50650 [Arthrobacter sp. Hiyo1]
MSILTAPKKTEKKERQKKPDELLASVVRETAVPAAVELLRSNAPFVFPSGTAWAILVLAAERIGGLSRKQGRDEAKGSLIELIEADSICTLATATCSPRRSSESSRRPRPSRAWRSTRC